MRPQKRRLLIRKIGIFLLFYCFIPLQSGASRFLVPSLRLIQETISSNTVPRRFFTESMGKETQTSSRTLILISLDWTRPKDPPLALGHASLLANLFHHHIPVISGSWAVNAPSFSHHHVTDFIRAHASHQTDVAFGAFVWNERSLQRILKDLRQQNFPGRIILGGPQISYVKKGVEEFYPTADVFIRGYAENALVKLMQEENTPIKGVHYAHTPDLGLSAMVDLETLPSPFLTGLIPSQEFLRWETQRGCPFRCSFCQHRESDVTMTRRQFSFSRIREEAEWIVRHPLIQDVAVLDPTFNSGPHYLATLDTLIANKFSGKLSLQCRLEMVTPDFLDRISSLNKTARVILEFGLQTIHPEEQLLIDRPNNMRRSQRILEDVYARQIECEVSLIFGLPNQTVSSFEASIAFCKHHKVPVIRAFPLMLLRGTPLYDRKAALGLVESSDIPELNIDRLQRDIPHVISSPSFTYQDWQKMAQIAENL